MRSCLAGLDDATLNRAWENAEFPFELVRIIGRRAAYWAATCTPVPEPSHLLRGLLTAELARKDASLATFVGVSGSLFGLSVRRFGSPAQQAEILPAVATGNWSVRSRSPSRTRALTSPGA